MIDRLAILGVGLIGGSLALSLKQQGLVKQVVGYGRSKENLAEALALGLIDEAVDSASQAVANADMVVMAVPIASMRSLMTEIKPFLSNTAILTDVGSAKICWIDDVLAVWDNVWPANAVPAHPIAGAEKSGAAAAQADLYLHKKVVLTPHELTSRFAIDQVTKMWQATGADVRLMSASEHDQIFAWTSHLPHLLSFALVDLFSQREDVERLFDYTAGGFRDFTRIAASDPTMWRDIVALNAPAISQALSAYQQQLQIYADLLQQENWQGLSDAFTRAKTTREDLLPSDSLRQQP